MQVKSYTVQIDESQYQINDPLLTGQQLLDLASKRPSDQFLVYQIFQNGQVEGIRPDETVDLQAAGIEKFLQALALLAAFAKAINHALNAFAALLALVVGLATAFDPRDVFDFLDQAVKHVGGVFLGDVDAVFRAGDSGDEILYGVRGFGAEL